MTAKRFIYDSITVSILKDGEFWLDGNVDTACNHSEICNELNKLAEENEQLKTKNNAYLQDIEVFKEEITHLKLENEQLQERNDRQAKRLDNLYRLVEEKDWRTLTDILDDFKRCEEQLQRESGTYW